MHPALLLLVDDSPEIGFIVQRYARQAGQEVAWKRDVASAWEWLRRREGEETRAPDLIILDMHLPGESGIVLCRHMAGVSRLVDLPIALFSDWNRASEIAEGLEAGARYVLCKDLLCRPESWMERLAEILPPPYGHVPEDLLELLREHRHDIVMDVTLDSFNKAMRRLPNLPFGPQVSRALLRKALSQAIPLANARGLVPGGNAAPLESFLTPDGLGLDPEKLSPALLSTLVPALAVKLAKVLWFALGKAARTPIRDLLGVAANGP